MKQEINLAGNPSQNYYLEFKARDGRMVYLGPGEQLAMSMIKDLPVADILHLMNINNEQLRCHLIDYKKEQLATIKNIVKKPWIYKTDNSFFNWDAHTIPGITTDFEVFKKQLKKKKCPFSEDQLESIIIWFTREESEVKLPLEESLEMKIARKAAAKIK